MPLSDYSKVNLVPFITGDEFPPYRSGRELVTFFNEFGMRDIYHEGMPINPKTQQRMSRTQYVEDRIKSLDDVNTIELLTKILNNIENREDVANRVNDLIQPEGYTVHSRDGVYSVIGGVINRAAPVVNQAHFQDIQNRILHVLNEAQVSITLVMAWFTNDILKDKLLERQAAGVEVRIAIYDDPINNRHGVDLTGLNVVRLRRGMRGGLMHDKFCVIDNQIVIIGSYNWTNNAEFRNDENITVERDPAQATRYSVEYRRLTTT